MTSMIFFNYAVDSTKASAVPFRSVRSKICVGSKHVDSTSHLLSAYEWLKLAPAPYAPVPNNLGMSRYLLQHSRTNFGEIHVR